MTDEAKKLPRLCDMPGIRIEGRAFTSESHPEVGKIEVAVFPIPTHLKNELTDKIKDAITAVLQLQLVKEEGHPGFGIDYGLEKPPGTPEH